MYRLNTIEQSNCLHAPQPFPHSAFSPLPLPSPTPFEFYRSEDVAYGSIFAFFCPLWTVLCRKALN